jgi:hypothetical protein
MHPETDDQPATLEHIQADICEMLRIFRRIEQVIDRYEPAASGLLRLRDGARFRKLGKGRADDAAR